MLKNIITAHSKETKKSTTLFTSNVIYCFVYSFIYLFWSICVEMIKKIIKKWRYMVSLGSNDLVHFASSIRWSIE